MRRAALTSIAAVTLAAAASGCGRAHVLTPSPFAFTVLAFGDSITEGQNGNAPPGLCGQLLCIDIPNAYPTVLEALLGDDDPRVAYTVVNAGVGGEPAIGIGESRLPGAIAAARPAALTLLHGTNDVLGNRTPAEIATAVRNMIRAARAAGVQTIVVSTLLPQRPGGTPPRGTAAAAVPPANAAIRGIVQAEGAILADAYARFLGHEATYLDADGLHLNPTGNRALAELFFEKLKEAADRDRP